MKMRKIINRKTDFKPILYINIFVKFNKSEIGGRKVCLAGTK